MKRYFFSSLLTLMVTAGCYCASAQNTVWHNPLDSAATAAGTSYIHGRGFAPDDYTRLPGSAKGKVRDAVWNLSRNSSGLYLEFKTDSPDITVQYEVTGGHAMPHMAATAVSGVDLYNGIGQRCWGDYSFGSPVTYSYRGLPTDRGVYTLYLPLYNTIKWLRIGVKEGSSFAFVPADTTFAGGLPIVIYSTSIAHGACASRPGMSWPNILHRLTGLPTVNLGFSGNGRLEPEVIDYVTSIPAALYIVDCMPNMYVAEDSVHTLVMNAVRQFRRSRPDTPILLTEHPGFSNRETNTARREEDSRVDRALRRAYADLRREGVKELHYLSREEIGMPKDGMVDYIHPSDDGMEVYAKAYHKAVGKILKLKH